MCQRDVHRVRRLRPSLLHQRNRVREWNDLREQQVRHVWRHRATVLHERKRVRDRYDLRDQPVCCVWRQWPTLLWHDLQLRIRLQQRHLRLRRQWSGVLRYRCEMHRHGISVRRKQYLYPMRWQRSALLHQRKRVLDQYDLRQQSVCCLRCNAAGLLPFRYCLQGRQLRMFRRNMCVQLRNRIRLRGPLLHVERGHLRRHNQVRKLGLRIRYLRLARGGWRQHSDLGPGHQSRRENDQVFGHHIHKSR